MNLKEIITNWVKISKQQLFGTNDVFFRFMSLWIGFNAFFTFKYGNIRDKEKAQKFAKEQETGKRHQELLQNDRDYENSVAIIAEKGVTDSRRKKRYTISDTKNFCQVMDCIYTIRCNLFHGSKLTDDLRDEKLVSASLDILDKLADIITR